jgi:threonylcarbamoyladenosine tRNA methylthiotransferase MtaB
MVLFDPQQLPHVLLMKCITSISFYTLGCRLNQSETAVLQHLFALDKAFQVVAPQTPSDIVVINTCTVTAKGDSDTRKIIHRVNRVNPKARIALIGCQSEIQKDKLTGYPNVKWVVGNAKKLDLVSIIKNDRCPSNAVIITPAISKENFSIPVSGINHQRTRANLKIQDGCNFFCSFCEIPYARGRARSRDFKNILQEARALAAQGHKELILTGINVGTYKDQKKTLLDVIKALEQIRSIQRIRISSIEHTTIDPALITHMAQSPKLCRYLHIPLQSAHDTVLHSMNRKYTYAAFKDFVDFITGTVDGICLGTDLIVGFPTETDIRFETTYERLKISPFHYFHVFSYSPRNAAKSRKFQKKVPPQTVQKRSARLRQLSRQKRKSLYRSFLGHEVPVLFEQKKAGYWTGLTDNYLRVGVRCEKNLRNRIKPVNLVSLNADMIHGQVLT